MRPRTRCIFLVLMTACAGSPNASRDPDDSRGGAAQVADTVRVLSQLQNSGWSQRETLVIDDTGSFQQAWTRVHADRSDAPPLPAVDFASERVAIVGAGTRSSGGHVMMPGSVRMAGDALVIETILQTPGAGCGTTAALTEPVIVLALRRTSAAPRITLTERPGPSCD